MTQNFNEFTSGIITQKLINCYKCSTTEFLFIIKELQI